MKKKIKEPTQGHFHSGLRDYVKNKVLFIPSQTSQPQALDEFICQYLKNKEVILSINPAIDQKSL